VARRIAANVAKLAEHCERPDTSVSNARNRSHRRFRFEEVRPRHADLAGQGATEASPAKNVKTNSAVATDEKTDAKKSEPHKHRVLTRQRNNYERPGYWNAPGYAEAPQRPFSNW
jgi:hypothetical protein